MHIPTDPSIWLKDLFLEAGLNNSLASVLSTMGLVLIVAILSWLSNLVAKAIINTVVTRIVRKTKSNWDDIFLEQKVFTRLSHFAPALVIWFMAGWALKDYPVWLIAVQRLTYVYMLIIGGAVLTSFIEAWYKIYLTLPISQHRHIKGYVQIVKIIIYLIFALIIVSVLFSKQVSTIIAGLGVMASVIMLIFKDAILGLVASIQLSANEMVKIGDWIAIPSREVDGEVEDITLTTVKIRNFNKTIITVPVYALVNESFENWSRMVTTGSRQIKRAFMIDMKSIKFAGTELLAKIESIPLLKEYADMRSHNEVRIFKGKDSGKSEYFSSGKLTNLGIFRMYAEAYLQNHPVIDTKGAIIIRHRAPAGDGLPLQVYAFTNKTDFITYENVQSEILEHLLAMTEEFGLKVFQQPTGEDIISLTKTR